MFSLQTLQLNFLGYNSCVRLCCPLMNWTRSDKGRVPRVRCRRRWRWRRGCRRVGSHRGSVICNVVKQTGPILPKSCVTWASYKFQCSEICKQQFPEIIRTKPRWPLVSHWTSQQENRSGQTHIWSPPITRVSLWNIFTTQIFIHIIVNDYPSTLLVQLSSFLLAFILLNI